MPQEHFVDRAFKAIHGSADDLRAKGFRVEQHYDFISMPSNETRTFWMLTVGSGTKLKVYKGTADSDAEALDTIRMAWAKDTDKLHHAPMCPANHYCGGRVPTGDCTCGAVEIEGKLVRSES